MSDTQKLQELANVAEVSQVKIKLGDSAQTVLSNLTKDTDKVFDYAVDLINKIRKACDQAEAAIKTKRKDVQTSTEVYVGSLQVVSDMSENALKAIGDVMLNGDRIGSPSP